MFLPPCLLIPWCLCSGLSHWTASFWSRSILCLKKLSHTPPTYRLLSSHIPNSQPGPAHHSSGSSQVNPQDPPPCVHINSQIRPNLQAWAKMRILHASPTSVLCPPDFLPPKPYPAFMPKSHTLYASPLLVLSIDSDLTKEIHMIKPYHKSTNNGKDQGSILHPKSTSPTEIIASEKYLDESQDTKFKGTIINVTKEFEEFKEGRRKISMKLKRIRAWHKHKVDVNDGDNSIKIQTHWRRLKLKGRWNWKIPIMQKETHRIN